MSTPAGWYPDPSRTGQQRYFDGIQWGPLAPPAPPPERRFTVHYGFALIALLSLIITVVFALPLFMTARDPGHDSGAGLAILWLLWGGFWTLVWVAFAIHQTFRRPHR